MNKQVLTLMIFLAAAVFAAWQYLLPEFNNVFALRSELIAWQEKLKDTQALRTKLADLEKKYAGMADQADRVAEALPAGQDIPGLLVQLEDLSARNGLIMQGFNFSAVDPKKSKTPVVTPDESVGRSAAEIAPASGAQSPLGQGATSVSGQVSTSGNVGTGTVKTLAIDLTLNGSQSSFMTFLKSIENNLRIMDVATLGFSGEKSDTGGSLGQDFKISLNTYFR